MFVFHTTRAPGFIVLFFCRPTIGRPFWLFRPYRNSTIVQFGGLSGNDHRFARTHAITPPCRRDGGPQPGLPSIIRPRAKWTSDRRMYPRCPLHGCVTSVAFTYQRRSFVDGETVARFVNYACISVNEEIVLPVLTRVRLNGVFVRGQGRRPCFRVSVTSVPITGA